MLLAGVTILLAVVLGFARGGRLSTLANARLHRVWVLAVALAAQAALLPLGAYVEDVPDPVRFGLLAISLAAILAFTWSNRTMPSMWLVTTGFALNAVVILLNGAMPVSPEAIAFLGGEESFPPGKHTLIDDGTVLPWLADVIPVPGLRIVVSVGDIVLALGVGALVLRLMRGPAGRHAAPYGTPAGTG